MIRIGVRSLHRGATGCANLTYCLIEIKQKDTFTVLSFYLTKHIVRVTYLLTNKRREFQMSRYGRARRPARQPTGE